MHIPKGYFHDRMVVLLLSISGFLVLLASVMVLLRLDSTGADVYIVQYRQNLSLGGFTRGGAGPLISFVLFAWLTFVVHTVLSVRVFQAKRQLAVVILAMGTLLLGLGIIVSNALLNLL